MSRKDKLIYNILELYNEFKHKATDNLDSRKLNLETKLQEELNKFDELLNMKSRLKEEEERINIVYFSLIEILKARGIILDIPNNNFSVKEWDNLYIKDLNGLYSFIDKRGNFIYALDKKYNYTIKYIISNYSYSIVITRKDRYSIKAQLRIVKSIQEKNR